MVATGESLVASAFMMRALRLAGSSPCALCHAPLQWSPLSGNGPAAWTLQHYIYAGHSLAAAPTQIWHRL
eukprot:10629033-Alexandrium_andersonii.AAC.1